MARKPAVFTRGTISGRPANASSCPRSVNTRAMPRLGGGFPPPDQFSQRIRAIGRLLFKYTGNHLANRCLCRRTIERHVAAKKLPDINVGQDDEDIEKLFARGALRALELRREHSLHAIAVIVSALFEGRLQPGVAALVIEPLHDEIANAFVNVEERSDRRLD